MYLKMGILLPMDWLNTSYEFIDQFFVHLPHHLSVAIVWILNKFTTCPPQTGAVLEAWLPLLLKPLAIILIFPGIFAFTTLAERKLLGRIQNRIGPNRVGPYGILQPFADGIKTLLKEDIIPDRADKWVHTLAPVISVIPAFLVFTVLPMGRNMTPADLSIGVFFFFAAGAISEIPVFLAGWGSHNKFSLLGGMRAIAQMISYEIPFLLSTVTVIMIVGSLSTNQIVEAQILHHSASDAGFLQKAGFHLFNNIAGWFIFQPWGFLGFIIFFIAALAELNRAPFDIPEAESEIIAGHHTEYSGFKFALFTIAEYLGMIAACGLASTLFLGGWAGPKPIPSWGWFFLKTFFLMFLMIWVRGTLPRVRVDQLMGIAWKFLLPLSLVNILAAGIYHHIPSKTVAWIVTAAILSTAYHLLSKTIIGKGVQKRTYRFA